MRTLLALWSSTMAELRERGVMRSANNPVADYAELLVAKHFGVEPARGSQAGYDLITKNRERIQVKGLRKTRPGRATLSAIRKLETCSFDSVIAVVFEADFSSFVAWKFPREVVERHGRWSPHVNGHLVTLGRGLLSDPDVECFPLTPLEPDTT